MDLMDRTRAAELLRAFAPAGIWWTQAEQFRFACNKTRGTRNWDRVQQAGRVLGLA